MIVIITIVILLIILLIILLSGLYMRSSIKMCASNVSMKGKVVIVTGANAGVGFHTAMDLARRGARVILACRHEGRGTAARDAIIAATGNTNVFYKHLDLSSLKSVRNFSGHIIQTEEQLHVLVNNAGVFGFASSRTKDGIIETMQINYFGHFLLTVLLLPLLKRSQPSRIINLSSVMHFIGRSNPRIMNKKCFLNNDFFAYSNSKFCMLMFAIELSRRLEGSGVVANAAHPGVINTGISEHIPFLLRFVFWCWTVMDGRSVEEGAQVVIHLAVADETRDVSGKYFVDCDSRLMLWTVANETTAKELWDYSENLVGIAKPY